MGRTGSEGLNAALVLQDGAILRGKGFGFPKRVLGEVVFNTGMVGYTEALTDPSYRGQILCLTYPLIGNYGVPSYQILDDVGLPKYFESDSIQVSGLILQELCERPSHWSSTKTLDGWLYEEGVPGIYGIDTRELTKKLRIHGVMMGALEVSHDLIDAELLLMELRACRSYGEMDFVKEVTVGKPTKYGGSDRVVALIDCGAKYSILRNLLKRGMSVVRLPYDTNPDEILSMKSLGVVISNGPGDPAICTKTIAITRSLVEAKVPVLGVCLGNQILALALGGRTFKLKYGHRGQNKPCVDLEAGRGYVTSQNHGYSVGPESLEGSGLKVWFVNADDGTVEGLKHESKPCIAVQFHPEAAPGPYDTEFVFDTFSRMVRGST